MSRSVQTTLAEGFAELGAEPGDEILGRLGELSALVAEWGRRINLSGHRTADQVAARLVLDAAALEAALPPFESLADLGSGAGFPGLPFAILRPGTRVVLVEARERRHHFQRHAIRQLEIANAHAVRGRIEDAEPEACRAVIAQAVAAPGCPRGWPPALGEPGRAPDRSGWNVRARGASRQRPPRGPRDDPLPGAAGRPRPDGLGGARSLLSDLRLAEAVLSALSRPEPAICVDVRATRVVPIRGRGALGDPAQSSHRGRQSEGGCG